MISAVSGVQDSASVPKPGGVETSARDFEALLIAQLLRAAREGAESAEADSVMQMAESQFASVLAANGGLGLAAIVTKALSAAPPHPTQPEE